MVQRNKYRDYHSHYGLTLRAKRNNNFVHKEKSQISILFAKCLGICLQAFVIFLAVAFISYILTYKDDQIVVEAYLNNRLIEGDIVVKNFCSLTGAVLSHLFIYKYFGIFSSFLILFTIYVLGAKLYGSKYFENWNMWKLIFLSLLLLFTLNTCIGVVYTRNSINCYFSGYLANVLGSFMNKYFGWGTYIIVLLIIVIYLSCLLDINLNIFGFMDKFCSLGNKKNKQEDRKNEIEVTDTKNNLQ